jgi:hypothetical protein
VRGVVFLATPCPLHGSVERRRSPTVRLQA